MCHLCSDSNQEHVHTGLSRREALKAGAAIQAAEKVEELRLFWIFPYHQGGCPISQPRFCGEMWEISLLSLCNGRNSPRSRRDEATKSVYFPHLPTKHVVYVAPPSGACAAFITGYPGVWGHPPRW